LEGGVVSDEPVSIADDVPIHRIGGGGVDNLLLKPSDAVLIPPGISALAGGNPAQAAKAMRRRFVRMAPPGRTTVGTTTAGRIREVGFDVIMKATSRFPQHARIIHPAGVEGFKRELLEGLAKCFHNQAGL
jgi:hypothetical protein